MELYLMDFHKLFSIKTGSKSLSTKCNFYMHYYSQSSFFPSSSMMSQRLQIYQVLTTSLQWTSDLQQLSDSCNSNGAIIFVACRITAAEKKMGNAEKSHGCLHFATCAIMKIVPSRRDVDSEERQTTGIKIDRSPSNTHENMNNTIYI